MARFYLILLTLLCINSTAEQSILQQVKSMYNRQRSSYAAAHKKDIFRYTFQPITLGPLDVTLPSLTDGHIESYDSLGGIIWLNNKYSDESVDSAYVIVKSWLVNKPDTTFRIMWFKKNSTKKWYQVR